jgi:hypothetical protein
MRLSEIPIIPSELVSCVFLDESEVIDSVASLCERLEWEPRACTMVIDGVWHDAVNEWQVDRARELLSDVFARRIRAVLHVWR